MREFLLPKLRVVKERKRTLVEFVERDFERVLVVKLMGRRGVKKVKEKGGIYRKMGRN